jgi:hypothetical protein
MIFGGWVRFKLWEMVWVLGFLVLIFVWAYGGLSENIWIIWVCRCILVLGGILELGIFLYGVYKILKK